jgi:hypothetical protein
MLDSDTRMLRLTFDETTNHQKSDYHATDSNKCLYPTTENVEHEAAKNGDRERPAVDDDLDLSLCLGLCDTGLRKGLTQIESVRCQ